MKNSVVKSRRFESQELLKVLSSGEIVSIARGGLLAQDTEPAGPVGDPSERERLKSLALGFRQSAELF